MNLCHLSRCFRWRHGWFIPLWTCSTKPTPRCFPLGLHLLRYRRFNLIGTLSGFLIWWETFFFLERLNWRLMITVQLPEEPVFIFLRWILPASSPWMIHNVKFHIGSALSRMDLSYWFSFGFILPLVFQLSNLTLSSQATGCPWFYWLLLAWGHYHGRGDLGIKHSYNRKVEKLVAYHVTGHRFLSRLQSLENSFFFSFFFIQLGQKISRGCGLPLFVAKSNTYKHWR